MFQTIRGLYATVGDLIKFSRARFAGSLLSADTRELFNSQKIQRRTRRNSEPIEDSFYGYGVTIASPGQTAESLGHTGGDFGSKSHLYYFPNYDLTIAVLSNRDTFSGASKEIEFFDILLESVTKP